MSESTESNYNSPEEIKEPLANTAPQNPQTETSEALPDKKELSLNPVDAAGVAIAAIRGDEVAKEITAEEITAENLMKNIEDSILEGVRKLPELFADKLNTVDAVGLNDRANNLLSKIKQEQDPKKQAELQTQLIYQYIGIISSVQNGGDKGFIPSVAKEVDGLDCSLSAWALKEKLQSAEVPNMYFEFGYLLNHAVAVIKVADDRSLYVDAQNGFVQEVELEEVKDKDNQDTAYPIFEITKSNRIKGYLPGYPDDIETTRARPEGSDYVPQYLGVREDGLLHTLGNMHMLINPNSPTFYTESAKRFRAGIGMLEPDPDLYEAGRNRYLLEEEVEWEGKLKGKAEEYNKNWEKYWEIFKPLIDKVAGGKTIYETKFKDLQEKHHNEYLEKLKK